MADFTPRTEALAAEAEALLRDRFREVDRTAELCTRRVMAAFRSSRVSGDMFAGTEGYGYDDRGRAVLERVFADIFGCEEALVRTGFANGTHAIASALYGALRPGQVLLSAFGLPYDTIHGVIGIAGEHHGSLKSYGIGYRQVEPAPDGRADLAAIGRASAEPDVGAVLIQRSRGYSTRRSLSVQEIREICAAVRAANPGAVIVVDNCYGEFVEPEEPGGPEGGDLLCGSLIKNPGGGLAPGGGYVAGKAALVERAAFRLTVPGIGGECGATYGMTQRLFHGLFLAPHTVAQALKTVLFCAKLMELAGYETSPRADEPRHDIIQRIDLGSPEAVVAFCRGVQAGSPIDAHVTPEPWPMPGYNCDVIMAAGTFVQGASIELSCDAPMREPYCVYLQGGLTYESGKYGIMLALERMSEAK